MEFPKEQIIPLGVCFAFMGFLLFQIVEKTKQTDIVDSPATEEKSETNQENTSNQSPKPELISKDGKEYIIKYYVEENGETKAQLIPVDEVESTSTAADN